MYCGQPSHIAGRYQNLRKNKVIEGVFDRPFSATGNEQKSGRAKNGEGVW